MTLLDMTLSASVLIGVILLLRAAALYRLPKWVFRVLWGVALVRMLVPVPLPSRFSIQNLAFPEAETVQTAPADPVSPVTSGADPSAVQTAPVTVQPPAASPAAPSAPAEAAASLPAVSPWTVLWLAGMILLAAALVLAYIRCLNRFRSARPVVGPRLEHWRAVCPGLDRVSVRVSGRVSSPMTYGLIRPVILLPNHTDWTDEEGLEYVFLHELTHIRNRDGWWKLALAAALCVHWFNPLAWWMYRAANQDIELSCDAAVMRRLGTDRRDAYALALLSWEERRGGMYPLCSSFGKKPMEERIVAIMTWKKVTRPAAALALVLVIGIAAVFATSQMVEPNQTDVSDQSQETDIQEVDVPPAQVMPSAPNLEDPAETIPEDPSKNAPAAVELQKAETARKVQAVTSAETKPAAQTTSASEEKTEPLVDRWGVPEELYDGLEIPVASREDGDDLIEYLCQVRGIQRGDLGTGSYGNGQRFVDLTYVETKQLAQFHAELPDGKYPVNSKGQTYGSTQYADYVGEQPDLMYVGMYDGVPGYVTEEEYWVGTNVGYPGALQSGADWNDYEVWCAAMPSPYYFPVYDSEHEKIVGRYRVDNDGGFTRSTEDMEELLNVVSWSLKYKLDYSSEEANAYVQAKRVEYGL